MCTIFTDYELSKVNLNILHINIIKTSDKIFKYKYNVEDNVNFYLLKAFTFWCHIVMNKFKGSRWFPSFFPKEILMKKKQIH